MNIKNKSWITLALCAFRVDITEATRRIVITKLGDLKSVKLCRFSCLLWPLSVENWKTSCRCHEPSNRRPDCFDSFQLSTFRHLASFGLMNLTLMVFSKATAIRRKSDASDTGPGCLSLWNSHSMNYRTATKPVPTQPSRPSASHLAERLPKAHSWHPTSAWQQVLDLRLLFRTPSWDPQI